MSDQQKNQLEATSRQPIAPIADAMEAGDTIDLTEVLFQLLSSWKLILASALILALVVGFYTVFFVTPKYEATSKIYVLSRKDSAINMSDLQIGAALTSDYIKIFDIWEVHEEVISNLNLPYTYTEMRSMLSVVNDSGTRMLDITFRSTSPQEAAAVANEYARVVSDFIADTMSTDKPNIMSVALTPTNPVSPRKVFNVALGFIIGALLACAYVLVRFILDDKYKTAEDIRKYTGLNTLAAIPDEDLDFEMERKNSRSGRREL